MKRYGVHWFRRDLRVAGNRALFRQFKENDGKVIGLFCFDKKFLARPDFSVNRFQIFLERLKALKNELRSLGSDLLVLDIGPMDGFQQLFESLKDRGITRPSLVSWCRDYEPFSRERDFKIKAYLAGLGISFFTARDHLLIEPHELAKPNGEGYQVYSPFSKRWLELFDSEKTKKRILDQKNGIRYLENLLYGKNAKIFNLNWSQLFEGRGLPEDHLEKYIGKNRKQTSVEIPSVESKHIYQHILEFQNKIVNYGTQRDTPGTDGTSRLSIYLKNGSVTVPQLISLLGLSSFKKKDSGSNIYFSELIWREFYYHVLFRNPWVETLEFVEKYRGLQWENNEYFFAAWRDGNTGFPIVDAGMRQLKTTGWMHNRVRMIVASFLTKDLLIDWRWGEKYFMETLLDGDLAPNNGGWQWAGSTGCDPQPYFRIFNPWLQSKKFDPEGLYIKKFVPELNGIESNDLHRPIESHPNYPAPIVDHAVQRDKALTLYKYGNK